MSRQFHALVTTPHAWRVAFSRLFLGTEALTGVDQYADSHGYAADMLHPERRVFNRLSVLASWRSEYIIRTGLLRSLARGKPAEIHERAQNAPQRAGTIHSLSAQITYNSKLGATVSHLHATFGAKTDKKPPRFIHGAVDAAAACLSNPRSGKIDGWGFTDILPHLLFAENFPGEAPYGLGPGDIVGVPNSMDISQLYGMVFAEGCPGGVVFFRSTEEKRGRHLLNLQDISSPEVGAPRSVESEAFCSVWIAKRPNVPEITDGLVGIFTGSSSGILSSYSLGTSDFRDRRLERRELTARWVLSPGVPIIAIAVDENLSLKRRVRQRVWAVALNALGEVFYLQHFPVRSLPKVTAPTLQQILQQDEYQAWETGRSVFWTLVEATKRKARPDPFNECEVDGSYSPRSSWTGSGLTKEQIVAETIEIESFIRQKPKHFRQVCEGWDMRRQLEVDFAASDENSAGEGIFVINRGLEESQFASIARFTRCKFSNIADEQLNNGQPSTSWTPDYDSSSLPQALLGNDVYSSWSFEDIDSKRRPYVGNESVNMPNTIEEWRSSTFSLDRIRSVEITTTSMDTSSFAVLTSFEDPLLCRAGFPTTSSQIQPSSRQMSASNWSSEIPGHRARLLAAGTKTGAIIIWNARASVSSRSSTDSLIDPVRVIHTESPQISCLALTALYLVHGGNDGLVQAWDVLASTPEPIRTLSSRFSSRARRRLIQAEDSPHGVGVNSFAAGAICLDPDPTSLRGMVSLGTHLRYWSFSSSVTDQCKSTKRRLRRSERGSNSNGDRFFGTNRGALKEYIANEKLELEREKRNRRKDEERLAGRFGLDLLGPGASEDDILAYATLLSEEAAMDDERRRKSESASSSSSNNASDVNPEEREHSPQTLDADDQEDIDLAEAIRRSLEETETGLTSGFETPAESSREIQYPIRYAKSRKSPSTSPPGKRGHIDRSSQADGHAAILQSTTFSEPPAGDRRSGKGKERRS